MNKLFTKIATAFVGMAMAVGVGVALGSNQSVDKADAATIGVHLTQVTSLTSGNQYVIVGNNNGYALPNNPSLSSGKAAGTAIASVPNDGEGFLWTFTKSGDYWLIGDGSKYIYHYTGGASGTNLAYGTGQASFPWSLTYSTSGQNHWTFAGVVANTSTVNNRGLLCNGTNFGGYSLSNESSYKYVNIYEVAAAEDYTVSFDANGGSGSMDNVEVSGSYTLPACTFGAPANKAFAGWKANNAGDLIAAGASYTVTADVKFYAQWANAWTVTYTAGEHGEGSFAEVVPEGTYTLLPFANLAGVSASVGYRFVDYTIGDDHYDPTDDEHNKVNVASATAVTVNFEEIPLEGVYDFTQNWATYASEWGGYAVHTVTGEDVGADYAATISFTNVSKQANTINDRPVIAAKSGVASTMTFALDNAVADVYNITTVSVAVKQWNSKKLCAALYKGSIVSGDSLDSFDDSAAPKTLTVDNLNASSFIVDFTTSSDSNQQLGITSITIGLAAKAVFGTLDHISFTSLPNTTIYHVGEEFSTEGLAITAYDGPNEATAAYKDVTASIVSTLNNGYVFVENDVPSVEVHVSYTESEIVKEQSYYLTVYACAQYELVTEEPDDWTGNYLFVSTYTDELSATYEVAMNSALENIDLPSNFKEVTINENTIIAGQECEFKVAKCDTGYSIQGKNGKYIYGNSSNRLAQSDSPSKLTVSFDEGIVTFTGGNSYKLKLGANRFGFYDANSNIRLFKLVESGPSAEYALTFLSAFTCNAQGTSAPTFNLKQGETYWSWALLEEAYNALSNADKEQFRLGEPSESGSNIQKALARYDYIVGKYYKTGLDLNFVDFMNRNPAPIQGSRISGSSVTSSTNNIIIIVVAASVLSLAAVSGCLLLRRRKHK